MRVGDNGSNKGQMASCVFDDVTRELFMTNFLYSPLPQVNMHSLEDGSLSIFRWNEKKVKVILVVPLERSGLSLWVFSVRLLSLPKILVGAVIMYHHENPLKQKCDSSSQL